MPNLKARAALVFVPEHNSHGKRDVTGAFLPEAKRFAALFGRSQIEGFDNSRGFKARRDDVLVTLRLARHFDVVAFFCHGWADGIQAGFKRQHAAELAAAIRVAAPRLDVKAPLYCCSTGDDPQDSPEQAVASGYHAGSGPGEGSFADRLRDELCAAGAVNCSVMGHTTVAHTTKNPNVLRFEGFGSPYGGVGGYRLVAPGSKLWPAWRLALQKTDLRFRFPFMTVAEIHAELAG